MLEVPKDQEDQDHNVGLQTIQAARQFKPLLAASIDGRFDHIDPIQRAGIMASVLCLIICDLVVETTPPGDRLPVLQRIVHDMSGYIGNGVTLDRFKLPGDQDA